MAENITLTDLVNLENDTSVVTAINNNNATITTALQDVVSRSGGSPNTMEANLDMNSNHILNLPTPTSNYDPVRLIDVTTINGSGVTVSSLPAGGSTSQVLTKNSSTNYDTSWQNAVSFPTGGSTGQVLAKNSGLNNDFSWSSSPTLSTINTQTGVLTLPGSTDTLAGLTTASTFTNKSIDGGSNTLTNIPVSSLNSGTSASSSTFWRGDGTWSAPPTGTITFLEEVTASNSASIASSASWSGYSIIEVQFFNLTPTVIDVVPEMQLHASGAYQTTSYTGVNSAFVSNEALTDTSSNNSYIPLVRLNSLSNTYGFAGNIRVYQPNSSANIKYVSGQIVYMGGSTPVPYVIGYSLISADVVDGLKIQMSSGNISSGFIRIFGIA